MNDHVLSCDDVVEFFAAATGARSSRSLLPEGAQNAFVNMYSRLAKDCPAESCEQRRDCVLRVDGEPKRFDGPEGKLRFLRMKVRTEGLRTHRRRGVDVLNSEHVSLYDDLDTTVRPVARMDPMAVLAGSVERDEALSGALASLRLQLEGLDLGGLRGGAANVAAAVQVALELVERTTQAPVPEGVEERRDLVRELLVQVSPRSGEGSPATVRQRQRRLRGTVREVLERAGGGYLAEAWVPLEENMRRSSPQD